MTKSHSSKNLAAKGLKPTVKRSASHVSHVRMKTSQDEGRTSQSKRGDHASKKHEHEKIKAESSDDASEEDNSEDDSSRDVSRSPTEPVKKMLNRQASQLGIADRNPALQSSMRGHTTQQAQPTHSDEAEAQVTKLPVREQRTVSFAAEPQISTLAASVSNESGSTIRAADDEIDVAGSLSSRVEESQEADVPQSQGDATSTSLEETSNLHQPDEALQQSSEANKSTGKMSNASSYRTLKLNKDEPNDIDIASYPEEEQARFDQGHKDGVFMPLPYDSTLR